MVSRGRRINEERLVKQLLAIGVDVDATNLETPSEFVESIETLFGAEILEKAITEPTLDRFLDGNPKVLFPTDEAYTPLVERLRRDRATNIAAEAKKVRGVKKEDTDASNPSTEESE